MTQESRDWLKEQCEKGLKIVPECMVKEKRRLELTLVLIRRLEELETTKCYCCDRRDHICDSPCRCFYKERSNDKANYKS